MMKILARYATALTTMVWAAHSHAGTAHGTLFVSVTIVGTCAVDGTDPAAAAVNCPEAFPYRVSVAPAAKEPGTMQSNNTGPVMSGNQRVPLAQLASNALRNGAATNTSVSTDSSGAAVTLLTISY